MRSTGMARRAALVAAVPLVVTLGLAGSGPAEAGGSGYPKPPPTNGFAAWGPWNTKLPTTVPLAANSAAIVANIKQDEVDNFGGWAVNTDQYSTPIYTVPRNAPRKKWTFSDCLNKPELAPTIAATLSSVPTLPTYQPSLGTDESL